MTKQRLVKKTLALDYEEPIERPRQYDISHGIALLQCCVGLRLWDVKLSSAKKVEGK